MRSQVAIAPRSERMASVESYRVVAIFIVVCLHTNFITRLHLVGGGYGFLVDMFPLSTVLDGRALFLSRSRVLFRSQGSRRFPSAAVVTRVMHIPFAGLCDLGHDLFCPRPILDFKFLPPGHLANSLGRSRPDGLQAPK